ncbi:hypothetical protein [Qipengyuania aquimaris]|uniref:hypothetical protein n=1 Tax=Qipengyuania aquimaris TaxID=255984 RepID=UPI001FD40CCD|nr:hypothetical protein [Qipengyuania aquimaris]UOR15535.1 hypothetical protein LCM05_00390 [Qipengyuania aquimaris]
MKQYDRFEPRLTLRFGVTGHRPPRLGSSHEGRIKAEVGELFDIARKTLSELKETHSDAFNDDEPLLKMVSSLAEGADTIAAEAAIDSGASLSVCLPFPPEVYARDFADKDWQRSAALIEQASSTMVLEGYSSGAEAGYEMAGQIVLSQCDILIAIWDGEAARGRGGTTQVIAEAVARHQPVIHIDADGKEEPQLLWSGLHAAIPDRPTIDGVERARAVDALPALIDALCAPPVGEQREALLHFVHPRVKRRSHAVAWPLLLWITGAKPLSRLSLSSVLAEDSADQAKGLVRPFTDVGHYGHFLNTDLLDRYARADAQASLFALRFRSSFVVNFALSGLAVLLALSGLLFPEYKKILIGAELLVILVIIINTRRATRVDFHRRWIDRRHLAERLRQLMIVSMLGRLGLREVENGTREPGWASWYARASARELGLAGARMDEAYLSRLRQTMLDLIEDQANYHRANKHSMHRANHRLHLIGDAFFGGTILACLAYLIVSFTVGKDAGLMGFGMAEIVTLLTALFPALAAALYGIRMQGDFAATSERSALIARMLDGLKVALEADPLRYDRLVERSRRLSEILLVDVQQWQLHFETRPMSLPG